MSEPVSDSAALAEAREWLVKERDDAEGLISRMAPALQDAYRADSKPHLTLAAWDALVVRAELADRLQEALYSWQQTLQRTVAESAKQERWARNLKERAREIRERFGLRAALSDSKEEGNG